MIQLEVIRTAMERRRFQEIILGILSGLRPVQQETFSMRQCATAELKIIVMEFRQLFIISAEICHFLMTLYQTAAHRDFSKKTARPLFHTQTFLTKPRTLIFMEVHFL